MSIVLGTNDAAADGAAADGGLSVTATKVHSLKWPQKRFVYPMLSATRMTRFWHTAPVGEDADGSQD